MKKFIIVLIVLISFCLEAGTRSGQRRIWYHNDIFGRKVIDKTKSYSEPKHKSISEPVASHGRLDSNKKQVIQRTVPTKYKANIEAFKTPDTDSAIIRQNGAIIKVPAGGEITSKTTGKKYKIVNGMVIFE